MQNSDDESEDSKTTQVSPRTRKTVTKRKRSTEVHKLSERVREFNYNSICTLISLIISLKKLLKTYE